MPRRAGEVRVSISPLLGREVKKFAATIGGARSEGRVLRDVKMSMGDGLFGLTQRLRRDLHREAGTGGCVSAATQVNFIAHAWPEHYPNCAGRFDRRDLRAFARCFGLGEGN